MSTTIKLKSSDGQVFEINKYIARKLGVLRTFLKQYSLNDKSLENTIIPLSGTHSNALKIILKWADNAAESHRKLDDNIESMRLMFENTFILADDDGLAKIVYRHNADLSSQ